VISLSDPLPGASRSLVGGGDNPDTAMAADTPQYRLIVTGAAPPIVAGRADDFTWPPRQRALLSPAPTAASVTGAAEPATPDARPATSAN
jgi:hypothetical protein